MYGASVWNARLDNAEQNGLIITSEREVTITVDRLDVAQFIYLILNNARIRDVIDTIGHKGVLLLGRFTPERKEILDALADALRRRGYVPIIFDFEKPTHRDITETVHVLAGLSLFVIADTTNPKSNPLELQAIVPDYLIPFVPLIQEGEEPFSMFRDLQAKYWWVLPLLEYDTKDNLLAVLDSAVILPALKTHEEVLKKKSSSIRKRAAREFLDSRPA